MTDFFQPRIAPEEVPEGPHPPKGHRRISFKRVERRVEMSRMGWREFMLDLGVRFGIAAVVVAVVALALWVFIR